MTIVWTEEMDNQLRALFADGQTYGQIGDVIGMNRNQIAGRCHRLGITRETVEAEERARDQRDIDILCDVDEGHSMNSVAAHYGVDPKVVRNLVKAARAC